MHASCLMPHASCLMPHAKLAGQRKGLKGEAFFKGIGGSGVIRTVRFYMSFFVQIDFIFLYKSTT